MNTAAVTAGPTCAVFGTGMVGLGAVAGCRLRGAERIIAVDLSDEWLGLARARGATETIGRRQGRRRADRRGDRRLRRRITLDEVNRGFELMEDQDGIRSVIEFG